MDVDEGETTIDEPVSAANPPHEPVYQCHVAPAESVPVTERVDDAAEHIDALEAFAMEGAEGVEVTFIVTFLQVE